MHLLLSTDALRECIPLGHASQVLCLLEFMRRYGLETHASLGNELLCLLVRSGKMRNAQQVFDKLGHKKETAWNYMIAGSVQLGEFEYALLLYSEMKTRADKSLQPDDHAFAALLKACAYLHSLENGYALHAHIVRLGILHGNVFVSSSLVAMYAKCGSLDQAEQVIDNIDNPNTITWNALLTEYTEQGHDEKTLLCVGKMENDGIYIDQTTLLCIFKACYGLGDLYTGQAYHIDAVKKGLESLLVIGNALVNMYARCGSFFQAQEVLGKLPVQNIISWTALMSGYVEYGFGEHALECFKLVQRIPLSADFIVLSCSLNACARISAWKLGQELHMEIVQKGFENELLAANALIDMYAKCGLLCDALNILYRLPFCTIVSWTALIAGYMEQNCVEEGLNCYEIMQKEGLLPDIVTVMYFLKACSKKKAKLTGQKIHSYIVKRGMMESGNSIGTSLLLMYSKCGLLADAEAVFQQHPTRTMDLWNALIVGYIELGLEVEAINCMRNMEKQNISSNVLTLVYGLKAYADSEICVAAWELHSKIIKRGFETETLMGNNLLDMYSRFGFLKEAESVFDSLSARDIISWNMLLVGYAQLGRSRCVFNIFNKLMRGGVKPDLLTFSSILNACSHSGLVEDGKRHFDSIRERYDLIPSLENCVCMADMFGRAGLIENAITMVNQMPYHPNTVVWNAACRPGFQTEFQLTDNTDG